MLQDHSKDFQQFHALMGLAWKNCCGDIFAVFRMWLGAMIFIAAFVVFWMLNVAQYQYMVTSADNYIAGTQMSIIIMSAMIGFVNAWTFFTFLAIVVCLFEYAMNFTFVCYYYDNKSWLVPTIFKDTIDSIRDHFKSIRTENDKESRKYRIYMENEVLKIRTGTGVDQVTDKD